MPAGGPPKPRVIWLLILGAVGVGILDAIQWQLSAELRGVPPAPLWYTFVSQFLPWCWLAALLPGVVWVANRFPLDDGRWRSNLWIHLVALTAFALLQIGANIASTSLVSTGPIDYLKWVAKMILFRFPIDTMAYWAAIGAAHGARAAAIAREREQQAAKLEASLVEVKLAALRDRLNPHFFFNTLNAVTTLALRGDNQGVIRTVEALSDLLRVSLAERKGQEAPLREELSFLDRYLEIEQLRFGDRLTVTQSVDRALRGSAVPVMVIQPLVENAIRYGAAVKPGPARIDLRVARDGDSIEIEVSDNGPGFRGESSGNGSGLGLTSCRARLAGLYGNGASLECGNRPDGGAVVKVRFPYRPPILTPVPA